ncbi:HNH endonuclease domain-containing protein [Anaerosporobacter faecicola]|uniref:HNH endonuclease domain-containing protein n=1 Tax=Anaerosporobacter faecicola TaxID=2718714 RepID=UPI001EE5B16B|nr:HNH endonuclease domain-containing protein [Anaerosporobacter faecicola]
MVECNSKKKRNPLGIDEKYYNALDIEGFSRMMKDPSYCYKFYWLEAIVHLIAENRTEATYDDVIDEMIANAWYPVVEYHIHLSGIFGNGEIKDNLERAVIKLQELSGLQTEVSCVEIKNAIKEFQKELHAEKMDLTKNVPYKALSGFANKTGNRISLDSSAGRMMEYYNRLSQREIVLPYTFGDKNGLDRKLTFSSAWVQMIKDHTVPILGWIQCEKVKWLQNNNPEVPGIIYKLDLSEEKNRKLAHVHKLWDGILELKPVVDVFTDEAISQAEYDVDHFIPWSFVMNDELWNLMPMDSNLNSVKSNKLPYWDDFFIRFAKNQYIMYEQIHEKEGIRKLYEACYRDNLHSIWANQELYRKGNSEEEFCSVLERNMKPVYDSARRQGYDVWDRRFVG